MVFLLKKKEIGHPSSSLIIKGYLTFCQALINCSCLLQYCFDCIFIHSGWKDVIDVGAIDCALPDNMLTCRNHKIQGFPTLEVSTMHGSNGWRFQTVE